MTCSAPACPRPVWARGFCASHYMRQWGGHAGGLSPIRETPRLSEEQIASIKARYERGGISITGLAVEEEVGKETVRKIVRGLRHQDVQPLTEAPPTRPQKVVHPVVIKQIKTVTTRHCTELAGLVRAGLRAGADPDDFWDERLMRARQLAESLGMRLDHRSWPVVARLLDNAKPGARLWGITVEDA